MRDENTSELKTHEEIEQYIQAHPEDKQTLVLGALYDERVRWQKLMHDLADQIEQIGLEVLNKESELAKLGRFKNLYFKISDKTQSKNCIIEEIDRLRQKQDELTDQFNYLIQNPPQDWRYELAMMGNNLFFSRLGIRE